MNHCDKIGRCCISMVDCECLASIFGECPRLDSEAGAKVFLDQELEIVVECLLDIGKKINFLAIPNSEGGVDVRVSQPAPNGRGGILCASTTITVKDDDQEDVVTH